MVAPYRPDDPKILDQVDPEGWVEFDTCFDLNWLAYYPKDYLELKISERFIRDEPTCLCDISFLPIKMAMHNTVLTRVRGNLKKWLASQAANKEATKILSRVDL